MPKSLLEQLIEIVKAGQERPPVAIAGLRAAAAGGRCIGTGKPVLKQDENKGLRFPDKRFQLWFV